METVDLIASGYEWMCPNCDEQNEEIEVLISVTCRKCKQTFGINTVEHAYE